MKWDRTTKGFAVWDPWKIRYPSLKQLPSGCHSRKSIPRQNLELEKGNELHGWLWWIHGCHVADQCLWTVCRWVEVIYFLRYIPAYDIRNSWFAQRVHGTWVHLAAFAFSLQAVYFLACRLPLRKDWCEGCTFRDLHKHQRTKESSSTNHLNPRNQTIIHRSLRFRRSEILSVGSCHSKFTVMFRLHPVPRQCAQSIGCPGPFPCHVRDVCLGRILLGGFRAIS